MKAEHVHSSDSLKA